MGEKTPAIHKQSPVQVWQSHFSIGTAKSRRFPISKLSVENGLKDTRLFQLKKTEPEEHLLLIINKQILSLVSFFNFSRNFNEDQVMDTAELILEDFDDFSFTAIMDCFHRIKTAKAPFDKKLYESMDGRKLLELFVLYREMQTEHLEQSHQERKSNAGNILKQVFMVSPDDYEDGKLKPEKKGVMDEVQKMMNKLKYDNSLKRSPLLYEPILQKKADAETATKEELVKLEDLKRIRKSKEISLPMNQMVNEWLEEFQKLRDKEELPKKINLASDFIKYKRSQIQINGIEVKDKTMTQWYNEFMNMLHADKLPDGIKTFSQFIEFKTF